MGTRDLMSQGSSGCTRAVVAPRTRVGQGGIRQEIVLNRAVANVVAKPGPAQKAVRSAGQLVRR